MGVGVDASTALTFFLGVGDAISAVFTFFLGLGEAAYLVTLTGDFLTVGALTTGSKKGSLGFLGSFVVWRFLPVAVFLYIFPYY